MSLSDEELQQQIEHKNSVENSLDARAYQKVFDALQREPYHLPVNFADRVIRRVEAGKTSLSKDYLWLAFGLFSFVVAAVITVVLTGFTIDVGAFRFVSSYSRLFVFAFVLVLIIQILDSRLIGRKMSV